MDNAELAQNLGIYEEIAALLVKRGIDTPEAAKAFLYPQMADMLPASGIANMDAAVARIRAAIEAKERILVFGDYDCDGICATAIMVLYLRSQGADVRYHIPRRADGYGLSEDAIELVVGAHLPDLMITVDCGITSCVEVEYAQDLGVDVIVTDHHEPQDEVPDCIVVNPKLGHTDGLRNLCGAAVAMKVVEALAGKDVADNYLDLAALATVADVVPLVGENRIIVYHGLRMLGATPRLGLRALIRSCELETVTSADIGFRIAPRINALGRLNDDADVVELFLTEDSFVIRELVEKVAAANTARQTLTKQLAAEAHRQLADYDLTNSRVIVLWDDHWEAGVLGLVASRLVSEFYRPVVLLSNVGEHFKGSARSVEGVNIFACLQAVEHRLVGFGGHMGAAGMSVRRENLQAFREELNAYICRTYPEDLFVPRLSADIIIDKNTMRAPFFAQLARLEPFGESNPAPKFVVHGTDCKFSRVGTGDHVKSRVNADVDLMFFGGAHQLAAEASGVQFDYYCDANKRVYQNREYIQLSVTDVVVADASTVRDSAHAFGVYLKTVLYPPREVGTRVSTLQKELASMEGNTGTLFVSYGADSARDFFQALSAAGKRHLLANVTVGKVQVNPLNTLLLTPSDADGWQFFSSIVFLDAPLSMGYLAWVGAQAPNPELVLLPHYAYLKHIAGLDLTAESVAKTLSDIRRVDRVRNVDELCMQLQSMGSSVANAYAHFYILFELGLVEVGRDFALHAIQGEVRLDASRVYKTLIKLREKG